MIGDLGLRIWIWIRKWRLELVIGIGDFRFESGFDIEDQNSIL